MSEYMSISRNEAVPRVYERALTLQFTIDAKKTWMENIKLKHSATPPAEKDNLEHASGMSLNDYNLNYSRTPRQRKTLREKISKVQPAKYLELSSLHMHQVCKDIKLIKLAQVPPRLSVK